MTINEAVKWIESLLDVIGNMEYIGLWNYEQPLTEIKELLEMLPAQMSEMYKWIPCSERVPEYHEVVLVCYKDRDIGINFIIDEEDKEWFEGGVVAWMPVPEPYKEGDES